MTNPNRLTMTDQAPSKLGGAETPIPCAPTAFEVSENISAFSIPPAEFLASRPDIHNLIAGTMVFRLKPDDRLETLLLQRAPSDSFPLKWEIPAGTADPSIDRSIAGVAVRELWEETQLRARKLYCTVGLGLGDTTTRLTCGGEVESATMDSELEICLLRVSGLTWAVVTFIADVEKGCGEVVLRPEEHTSWAWIGEDEVMKEQFCGKSNETLEFVSEAMKMTLLQGFKLRKHMMGLAG